MIKTEAAAADDASLNYSKYSFIFMVKINLRSCTKIKRGKKEKAMFCHKKINNVICFFFS